MEFFAYHGCFAEEQIIGNKFIVDLEFSVDTKKAERTDDLSNTINYQHVYNVVKAEMEIKSKLLEHVAGRILHALKKQFPSATNIKITVSKLNPPLNGKVDKVSYTIKSDS